MKTIKIIAIFLGMACAAGFTACSDEDVLPALDSPEVVSDAASYNSLTFSWNKIPGAVQYGYQLIDADGEPVHAAVTKNTRIWLTGLLPDTEYTLRVWPFAGLNVDYSTPPAVELRARTAAIIKLATPTVTASGGEGSAEISWNAVEGAESYSYEVTMTGGELVRSGSVDVTSVALRGLDEGDYTVAVCATTTAGGYSDSDTSTATFHVDAVLAPLWSATGTYSSGMSGETYDVTIIANSDGSYSMPAFYGVDGYSLDFIPGSDGSLQILNGVPSYYEGYVDVETGTSYGVIEIYYEDGDQYSGFSGDSDGGMVWLGYYGADGNWYNDQFTWSGSSSGSSSSLTTDDLAGSYKNHIWGYDWISEDGASINYDDFEVTIEKVDDTTVNIDGIYWIEVPVEATWDAAASTLTIAPQDYYGYIIATQESETSPIVCTVATDGTITVPEFALWWDGYTYLEVQEVWTKKNSSSAAAHKTSILQRRKAPKSPDVKLASKKHVKKSQAGKSSIRKPARIRRR